MRLSHLILEEGKSFVLQGSAQAQLPLISEVFSEFR